MKGVPVFAEDSDKDKENSDKDKEDDGPFSSENRVRTIFYIIGLALLVVSIVCYILSWALKRKAKKQAAANGVATGGMPPMVQPQMGYAGPGTTFAPPPPPGQQYGQSPYAPQAQNPFADPSQRV
jgi:hypothetical protein